MTREEIIEFFAGRDAAWQRHDSTALADNHAEFGEVDSPLRGKFKGKSAILRSYADWYASFPDSQYVTEHLLIDGNRAAQFIEMTGTQQGHFFGLPPTGKKFRMRCAFLFTFAGDKIEHELRVYDFTGILVQLGVLKAKPGF